LNKDRNILPLYNGNGARAAGPTHGNGNNSDDNSNGYGDGDGSVVETAAASDNADVIPPRPRSALLFGAAGAATTRLEGSESSAHEAEEDDSQLSLRDLVLEILQERVALERTVHDLEQRNCDLRFEPQEREVRHLQETIKLVQHIGRLRRQMVRKDQMLCRAYDLLPPGWSDGI